MQPINFKKKIRYETGDQTEFDFVNDEVPDCCKTGPDIGIPADEIIVEQQMTYVTPKWPNDFPKLPSDLKIKLVGNQKDVKYVTDSGAETFTEKVIFEPIIKTPAEENPLTSEQIEHMKKTGFSSQFEEDLFKLHGIDIKPNSPVYSDVAGDVVGVAMDKPELYESTAKPWVTEYPAEFVEVTNPVKFSPLKKWGVAIKLTNEYMKQKGLTESGMRHIAIDYLAGGGPISTLFLEQLEINTAPEYYTDCMMIYIKSAIHNPKLCQMSEGQEYPIGQTLTTSGIK